MAILAHERDRPVIESRQDHRAATMMHDLASVGLIAFTDGVNRDVEHPAREDLFRIEERRSLLSHSRSLVCRVLARNAVELVKKFLDGPDEIERARNTDQAVRRRQLFRESHRL